MSHSLVLLDMRTVAEQILHHKHKWGGGEKEEQEKKELSYLRQDENSAMMWLSSF